MTNIRSIARILILIAAGSAAGVALAQGPGYWHGPGAGPGYGPGMGPGMMGGGPGYGGGRGPGMMQGGRGALLQGLGLNDDQRMKIARIREDTRSKNWDVMGQVQAERFRLREMYAADKLDPAAITEQQRKVDDLKRQVLRARLEARNQVSALLTPEQRQKLRSFGMPRWARDRG